MKNQICNLVVKYFKEITVKEIEPLIEVPPQQELGDYSLPCFSFAKKKRMAPAKIAEELKELLEHENTAIFSKITAVNGYLNFFIEKSNYTENIIRNVLNERYGSCREGEGKIICIDYSSPNIAKNFHVGHLRTTLIGNSLYKIFTKLGYQVVRINYIGDWGTQFGKLIVAYQSYSSKEQVEEGGIEELLRIYIKFNEEAELQPELLDQARSWFVKMEQGEEEALAIWNWFKDISLKEFEHIYNLLGVQFDSYAGESFYMDQVPVLVESLKEKNLLEESQGAAIINLNAFEMPPCLIQKSDGSSIYHSRDIAAAIYRKKEYQFEQCLYVTGLEQLLHFAQVFKAIELMGYEWSDQLVHVPYGLVRFQGGKLSTRNGNIIYAEAILNEAISRAAQMIEQKNPRLLHKEKVAKQVGIGAVIFHDLFHQRIKNIEFSWDTVLNFEGATGPYIQYTCARAGNILRKCGYKENLHSEMKEIKGDLLSEDCCYAVIKLLAQYPEKIKEASERYEPSVLAKYTLALATVFNQFYHDCNVQNAEEEVRKARLDLVCAVKKVILDAAELLGIVCPDEM